MSFDPATHHPHPGSPRRGFAAWWHDTPLYLRIVGALVLGVLVGTAMRMSLGAENVEQYARLLEEPSKLILRLLGALAPPLILFAIVQALMTADARGGRVSRLAGLLVLNTVVAILVGLLVANVLQPGKHAHLTPKPVAKLSDQAKTPEERQVLQTLEGYGFKPDAAHKKDVVAQFLDNVPDSLLRPLVENNKVIGVIFVAVGFGIALRSSRRRKIETVEDLVGVGFDALLTILHWVIQVVPLGVFGIVTALVAEKGFEPFIALGAFIGSVLLALFLQACYYMVRIRTASWVSPTQLLRGTRDALVMAFSTASSTVTMPVTYAALRDRVGIREESASMGALVGANFNNDGTALYEAMAALFIAQMLGISLPLDKQIVVVLTSIFASIGAAGIPEAGLVTMTLVFKAVGLPTEYIALLITVDWFLDRCRTAINVMGDTNVSCILDGKTPPAATTA
jgi:DAACS family dicarboxylate/amino acid:cation (Na+ or H+) symporter